MKLIEKAKLIRLLTKNIWELLWSGRFHDTACLIMMSYSMGYLKSRHNIDAHALIEELEQK